MNALGFTSYLLSWGLGWLFAVRCWPADGRRSAAEQLLLVFLGWPIGAGVTSSLYFVSSLFCQYPALNSAAGEFALLLSFLLTGGARPPGALSKRQAQASAPEGRAPPVPANAPGVSISPARATGGGGCAPPVQAHQPGGRVSPWISRLVLSLVAQVALAALVLSVRAAHLEPFGSWDGWAIWNLHARFMFRAGPHWPSALSAPELIWTHADYPWLVPAGVARVWSWMGRESPLGSAGFSLLFGVATAGLLGAALWRRRGPVAAGLAVLVLLSTPFFVTFSSNEHADVPFGLYVLAACVLIAEAPALSHRLAWLTGLVIGFAPFVKNEGLLWLPLACVGWLVASRRTKNFGGARPPGALGIVRIRARTRSESKARPEVALHHAPSTSGFAGSALGPTASATLSLYLAFLGGLLVALLPLIYFKLLLAPANDLASSHPAGHLPQLLDPARHRLILASLRRDLAGFGQWRWTPLLPLALALVGLGWRRLRRGEWIVAALLLLTLAGYYGVYLLSPFDLRWHLDSSLVRLLLQLWPAALFWWGLAATLPGRGVERVVPNALGLGGSGGPPLCDSNQRRAATATARWAQRAPLKRAGRPSSWLAGNALAGALLLVLLNRHLAPGELARSAWRIHPVHASAAAGWYPPEAQGAVRWAWSSGPGVLRLYAATPQTVRLRFALRGLQPQRITATWQGRILWTAVIGTQLQRGEIADLTVPAGGADLIFTSDHPCLPESADARSRTLAFALYQLRID